MARANLSSMDVQELLNLRKRVDATLAQRRTDLEKQLRELGSHQDGARVVRGRGSSPLTGRKVAAKYRGPDGETWAGRGAKPRWLVAAMKETGKKVEDFLIDKSAHGGRRKRRAKR
jgi:DNA-binding protein H-NS